MQESRAILLAQRQHDLSSRLSELVDLRLRVEEAELRAHALPRVASPHSTVSREKKSCVRPLRPESPPKLTDGHSRSPRQHFVISPIQIDY
jgi:hypothetical protein